MSKRSKKVGVVVKAVPIPRPLARAQATGEMVKVCGGNDDDVARAQKALALGLVDSVVVYGVGRDGAVHDHIVLRFDESEDDIELDLDGGRRSAVEALDAGMSEAVRFQAERFRRRGWSVEVRYQYRTAIWGDAERLARARAELGTAPAAPPRWPDGWEPGEVSNITPGKDKGMTVSLWRLFKKRGD